MSVSLSWSARPWSARSRTGAGVLVTAVSVALVAGVLPGPAVAADVTPPPVAPAAASSLLPELTSRPDLTSAQLAAGRLHRRIEVESATTQTSRTWVLPDGSLSTETAAAPVRVRREGKWVDIDTTLVVQNGVVQPKAAAGGLELSAGGAEPDGQADLVTFAGPKVKVEKAKSSKAAPTTAPQATDGSLVRRWPGRLPAPTLQGDTATYPEVAKGVDLQVPALRDGFKDSVVLKTPQAAKAMASWRIPLKGTGLTAAQQPDGTVRFTDSAGGPVAVSAPAVMWDARRDPATGNPLVTAKVTSQVVTATNGRQELVLTPDADFLSDPKTVFPVTIDPTTTQAEINDTWVGRDVTNGAESNSAVSPDEMRVGFYGPGNSLHRSLIKFDTGSLAGQYVNNASLSLYQYNAIGACDPSGFRVYGLTGAFSDATTWSGQPGSAPTVEASATSCAQAA